MSENSISETTLRGEVSGPVKNLRGFMPFHHPPEEFGGRAERFVQQAGSDDVAERAAALFDQVRQAFRYKRKELALACDGASASITTPDFEVALNLSQNPAAADQFLLSTEVSGIRREQVTATEAFASVFNSHCDTIAVLFARPVDLEEKIDRIEENEEWRAVLNYDAACSWFTLQFSHLQVKVTRREMLFSLAGTRDLAQLISGTNAALGQLLGAGFLESSE